MTLAEALAQVNLEPGKTYQVQVTASGVQVRVRSDEPIALAKPFEDADVIVDVPYDLASMAGGRLVQVVPGRVSWPSRHPFVITDDDLAPGDLP